MRPLAGTPMILFLLERIKPSRESDTIVLATTDLAEDDELANTVEMAGFPVYRGNSADVVARYVGAAELYGLDYVVRVTGDCPFVDAETLDYCVSHARRNAPFDLASTKGHFPVGIDYEIYGAATMAELHQGGELTPDDREHLTLFMYHHRSRFRILDLEPLAEWRTDATFTVDTLDDYRRAQDIVSRLGPCATISELARNSS
jgi:spore coat polysaccharide biosynthesis protein SpsF